MSRSGEMADRFGWAALAAALAVCAGPTAAMAQTQGAAPPAQAEPGDAVLLEADEVINDEAERTVIAQGDVQVRYQGRTMRADRLIYNLDTGAIRAEGDVQVVLEDGSTTYAEAIEADEALNVGAAAEIRARLGNQGRLAARARCATAKAKANCATLSTRRARSAKLAIARRPGACARAAPFRTARAAPSHIRARCSKSSAYRFSTFPTSRTPIQPSSAPRAFSRRTLAATAASAPSTNNRIIGRFRPRRI
ncbi:MAG: hypothetical protein R3C16_07295 [Hyphomonadaceae bacterium]